MSITEEMTPAYARHVGERLRNIRRQQGCHSKLSRSSPTASSRRRCSGRTSEGRGSSRSCACNALPACTASPLTSCCPRCHLTRTSARKAGHRPRQEGPDHDRPVPPRALGRSRARGAPPLHRDDPNPAGRLQRPPHNHPFRGRAGAGTGVRARRTCDAQPHRRARHQDLIACSASAHWYWSQGGDPRSGLYRVRTGSVRNTTVPWLSLTQRPIELAANIGSPSLRATFARAALGP